MSVELEEICTVVPEPLSKDVPERFNKKGKKDSSQYRKLKEEIKLCEHTISVEALCEQLSVEPGRGLDEEEARRRLAVQGFNQLTPRKQVPEIVKFVKQLTSWFSLLLWAGSALSGVAYGLDRSDMSNLWLCIILAVVVLATGAFSYLQERNSSDVMNKFRSILPSLAKVIRGGAMHSIEAKLLVPGDIVHVKAGDKIPADMRIIHSQELIVDNSSLTGEAEPQLRKVECTSSNPLESANLAFFGTLATSGNAVGIVILTGDNSIIGRIAQLASMTGPEETGLHKEINRFILIVSVVAVSLGAIFLVVSTILDHDVFKNVLFMIGIIVANVPEGLLATVTVWHMN